MAVLIELLLNEVKLGETKRKQRTDGLDTRTIALYSRGKKMANNVIKI